jgi:hypothetical protein
MLTLLPLSAASSVLPFPLSPLFFPVALSPFAIDVGHEKRCASCGVFHKEHHVVERTHPYITTSKLNISARKWVFSCRLTASATGTFGTNQSDGRYLGADGSEPRANFRLFDSQLWRAVQERLFDSLPPWPIRSHV